MPLKLALAASMADEMHPLDFSEAQQIDSAFATPFCLERNMTRPIALWQLPTPMPEYKGRCCQISYQGLSARIQLALLFWKQNALMQLISNCSSSGWGYSGWNDGVLSHISCI